MGLLDVFKKKQKNLKRKEEILEILKNEIKGKEKLEELVNAFERMTKIPIEGVGKEQDMILFELGTFCFTGESLFHFSLVRQIPNDEEEYIQIHLVIQYKPNEINKSFSSTVWNFDISQDIFEYIRKSEEYLLLQKENLYNIDVYMDET